MPRAFLIKSRAACPAPKKENIDEQTSSHENGQATEGTSNFTQDSTTVDCVTSTSSPAQVTAPDEAVKKSYTLNSPTHHVREDFGDRKPSKTPTHSTRYPIQNITEASKARKRAKRSYHVEDHEVVKKVRKSHPKKTTVNYYETENFHSERNGSHKDEARFGNYTPEKRHYANEATRYHPRELTSQSQGNSSGKIYSQSHGKQDRTFAYQNNVESLDRGKPSAIQRENKDFPDKNTGLENVMIVEYHSVRSNRRPSYHDENNTDRTNVTQRSSQGYYSPPQSSPVVTTNYVPASPVTTSTAPVQQAQPPRVSAQPMPTQETAKNAEQEPKVVYVPVYPVSQGPNGVIYEPIPNATPIMAKDTLPVQKVQQSPPQHVQEQPRIIQAVPPPRQEVVMSPPSQPEQKPRVEYRPYEPIMPQQLAATPAPQTYQPHPQGHVIIQQPHSASATPTTYAVAQVPQYAVRPAPPSHQYQQQQPHQQSPPQPHQHYQARQPPTSAPQTIVYRAAAPSYQEPPHHYYPRPPTMQGYQERVIVQPVHGPPRPPISIQQPMYHHQERPSHTQQPARPPPLPSQPQHAEKPALPSPSYPQESANRLLTPRYTPDGTKHEHKFVYAPPPADFMNSPVYRVPTNDENTPIYHHEKADRHHHKTGSRKRKPSYPTHAVFQNKAEPQDNLPSPADTNSRTPSPKETDLRCNERLVKSPHQPSHLNKSSLVMTPPVSPNDRSENQDTVTVVVRDQGIQASPRSERALEHTCFRKTNHARSNSYQSDSSEEDYMDDDKRSDNDEQHSPESDMYTEDGTLVVHIPHPDNNNNDSSNPKKQRSKKSSYRFMCKFCSKGFQWHSHLESHERTHTGEKPFKCPECDRAFCRADGLQCHMLVHNKKRPYKCPHCGKGFTDKIVLEKHIYSHTGVKPFKCEYCGRAFSDSLSIEKHLLVHTGTKPYKCPYCVRSFNDSQMLVRHIRSHTGEKPFKCKHCPMAFSKQSALIIHTRVHTGEKPYKCPHCVKSFSISGNLQRHILIHTGERPYKCSKCPKAFNNPSHLSRHISKLHAPQNGTMKQPVKYEQYEHYSRDQPVM